MSKQCSRSQLKLIDNLFHELGIFITPSQMRAYKYGDSDAADRTIKALLQRKRQQEELTAVSTLPGMATQRQIDYLGDLRMRLNRPLSLDEIHSLRLKTTRELQTLQGEATREYQAHRDHLNATKGTPLPKWREQRPGLIDHEKIDVIRRQHNATSTNAVSVRSTPLADLPEKVQKILAGL